MYDRHMPVVGCLRVLKEDALSGGALGWIDRAKINHDSQTSEIGDYLEEIQVKVTKHDAHPMLHNHTPETCDE